ncbi:GPW/gp25 family protein [Paraflavitalea pollutisoli]|uniref:GPW/gp25 family protein n=1 Tax=Paraflavitalea pollutisoli TaxID=3034143 RepID=UPI0023EC71BC|nr:GPW/gp25 family protein [Paraflavitalea sp. H1-2-19X]
MSTYYKIPLQLDAVMKGNKLTTCDLAASIRQNLEMILTARYGEHRSDPSFGCEIWNLDFELISSVAAWEEGLRKSLIRSVTSHELRLTDVSINVTISDLEKYSLFKQSTEMKKRVNIQVVGTIAKTGIPFQYDTSMFLSPLSIE